MCRLLHTTLDEDVWVVQWFKSHDTGTMTKMRYYTCYVINDAGDEEFTNKPKAGWKELQHTVYKRSFITLSFKLDHQNRWPAPIRAVFKLIRLVSLQKGK